MNGQHRPFRGLNRAERAAVEQWLRAWEKAPGEMHEMSGRMRSMLMRSAVASGNTRLYQLLQELPTAAEVAANASPTDL